MHDAEAAVKLFKQDHPHHFEEYYNEYAQKYLKKSDLNEIA